jgi:hypothetical protein
VFAIGLRLIIHYEIPEQGIVFDGNNEYLFSDVKRPEGDVCGKFTAILFSPMSFQPGARRPYTRIGG